MRLAFFSAASFILTCTFAFAINASPHVFRSTLPNGREIELRIRGDEFFNWLETLDGYAVVRDRENGLVYADVAKDGMLVPSIHKVGVSPPPAQSRNLVLSHDNIRKKRSQIFRSMTGEAAVQHSGPLAAKGVSRSGRMKNLVILMRFSNHEKRALPSPEEFNLIFNSPGGDARLAPTGSVRDAYYEYSYGALTIDSTVVAWINLPKCESYYADKHNGMSGKLEEGITAALTIADETVDFRDFDENQDGMIDGFALIHSGYGAEWGDDDVDGAASIDRIWSHRGWISTWTSAEGVSVRDYHVNPGLWGVAGEEPCRIGVICHESGHFLGLPDLYSSIGGQGLGSWCLMSNSWGFDGSQQYPPHPSAWCKVALGWLDPTELKSSGTYHLLDSERNRVVFKIKNGYAEGEYLLIENRQPVGFDSGIPVGIAGRGGLAIWHVDEGAANNGNYDRAPGCPSGRDSSANKRHYGIALLQADGRFDLECCDGNKCPRGDGNDVFRDGYVSALTPSTIPNSNGYANGIANLTSNRLTAISHSGTSMSFQYDTAASQSEPSQGMIALPNLTTECRLSRRALRRALRRMR